MGWCWVHTEVYCWLACSFSCFWATLANMHGWWIVNRHVLVVRLFAIQSFIYIMVLNPTFTFISELKHNNFVWTIIMNLSRHWRQYTTNVFCLSDWHLEPVWINFLISIYGERNLEWSYSNWVKPNFCTLSFQKLLHLTSMRPASNFVRFFFSRKLRTNYLF